MNKYIRVRGNPFCAKAEAYYSALQITKYLKPPTELRHKATPIVLKKLYGSLKYSSLLMVLPDIHDKERISAYSESEDILRNLWYNLK
jgi:hypothetical protein